MYHSKSNPCPPLFNLIVLSQIYLNMNKKKSERKRQIRERNRNAGTLTVCVCSKNISFSFRAYICWSPSLLQTSFIIQKLSHCSSATFKFSFRSHDACDTQVSHITYSYLFSSQNLKSTSQFDRRWLFRSEESSGQLQLVEREDIEDDEDLFEAIDKCIFVLWTLVSRSIYIYLTSLRSSFNCYLFLFSFFSALCWEFLSDSIFLRTMI